MTTDLEQRILRYVDSAPPITLDEVTNPSRPLPHSARTKPRVALVGLAVAAVLAGVAVAVESVGSGHNEHSISVVSPTATTLYNRTVVPPLAGCRWIGFTSDRSTPTNIPASGAPRGYWTCPTTVAQAEQVLGFPLPTLQAPTGWSVATEEIRGSGTTWDYSQTWTPDGRPIPGTPSEQFVELRVARHPPGRSTIPTNATLASGDPARVSSSGEGTGILWTHHGVDYLIGSNGLNQAQVLSIADVLARSLS